MLLGLTYSEFDNHVGPQLRFSFPENIMSSESFEQLSDFVIVGRHLTNKIIVVKTEAFQFANFSVIIDNEKYERNALLFALGLVLSLEDDPEPYEVVLRKVASTLVALELEKEYLYNPATKQQLKFVLQSMYYDLRRNGSAQVEFDEANVLSMVLFKSPSQPIKVRAKDVPVLFQDFSGLSQLPWDISILHLLPHIDGVRTAQKCASDAAMDIDCVKKCLRILLHYGCIILTDIFKFSNIYQLVRVFDRDDDAKLLSEIAFFCCGSLFSSRGETSILSDHDESKYKEKIVALLTSLKPGFSLGDIITGPCFHLDFQGIDIRKLIAIALYRH